MSRLRTLLPALQWAPRYARTDFRADLTAGFTTAVMLVPQGMGYAMLAGLPPIVGLYASIAPLLVYALLGTSRPLAVGPVAMDSLLVAVAVSAIAESGSDAYLSHAVLLGAMVGTIQLVFGALGMGFVVNFMSRPVISGFTSAAALIIGASQLRHLLGMDLPQTHSVPTVIFAALTHAPQWHLPTLALGAAGIVTLVALERMAPKIPRAMVAVVLTTVAVAALELSSGGVSTVGIVPAGLPGFALPHPDLQAVQALWPAAFTIALVSFVEAISVGKHFARLGRYELDPGQELRAIGAANLAGSMFGGYPIAGGFSRTAVNAQAGARTQAAGVFTALLVALTLVLLTPLFTLVPKAVLAAIIFTAVLGLFDAGEARRLYAVKRVDFWLLVFTFTMTLVVGIQYGILAGMALSLLLFVVQTTRPHFAVLGRMPGTEAYLNVRRHPQARTYPGILVVRVDAQFYFGNVSFLKETLRQLEAALPDPLRAVVLDASGINQLDSSAEGALRELDTAYREAGVLLLLSHVKGPVRDVMYRTGLLQELSEGDRIFLRTHDAVERARGRLPRESPRREEDVRAPADRIGCSVMPGAPADDGADDTPLS